MIDYIEDSCTGRINNFPHIMQGVLNVSLTNGNGIALGGCCPGAVPGCEILKCDNSYIYVRDRNMASIVNVYDEKGYKVKELSINDLDL